MRGAWDKKLLNNHKGCGHKENCRILESRSLNPRGMDENRYIRNQPLELMLTRPTMESALWKIVLAQKGEIMEILECRENNRLFWENETQATT